ncbi:aldo/keto reductase [Mesorhizobium sp. B2-3-4]|uniref:aldo/keto reductase n=1 Tax=Mesorhizobium sp. B2-3-4 TaxID=2589959 RepID=UPI00112A7580|nr:aldo/keto reductase [Mesorhizobium sp. B2-3-4]TPM36237.1 aldo/keto reductase [Mesorhizobium sp. B2-3-4]
MGCASLGGLYAPVDAETCMATLQAASDAGIGYFDAAPMYGLGRAEHMLGHFLREHAANIAPVVSTKVGRLMTRQRPGLELPPEAEKNPLDAGWQNGLPFREVFDYSYDAIMRSFDDSQQRMGRARIDILFVHDIGKLTHADAAAHHWSALTRGGGFRALSDLRDAGIIGGFGLGVNEAEVVLDAMSEARLDCTLLAGRHTLLEQNADTLLEKAAAVGMSIVIGGVFNSGILAAGNTGNRKFNYQDVPETVARKVDELSAVCDEFGVPLAAAAIQFPFRHRAVTSVLIGAKHPDRVRQNVEWFERPLPEELWRALEASGLVG